MSEIFCPSSQKPGSFELVKEPCTNVQCVWWKTGCSASLEVQEQYSQFLDRDPMPNCPDQEDCRWHQDAVKRGDPGCTVRRLGMVCEHAGGEWNTFEIGLPEDWE